MSTGTAGSAGWFSQSFRTFPGRTRTGCTRSAVLVVVADPDGAAGPIFERDEMTDTMSDARFAAATPYAPQTEYGRQDQSAAATQYAAQTQTPNGPWARAERSLPVAAAVVRREVIGTLRMAGFRIDIEQLGYVAASRGSHLGSASGQPDKLPVEATAHLADGRAGCTVWIQLANRGPAGLGRMIGIEAAYRAGFVLVMAQLDNALARVSPDASASFGEPMYSNAEAPVRVSPPLARGRSTLIGQVNKMLDAPTSGHASRAWKSVGGASVVSPAGVATLDVSALQTMATLGTQLVENPGSVPQEQLARVAELVGLLDAHLSASSGSVAVRIDVTQKHVAVVEFLRQQARIRDRVELRMRQRCRTCYTERIINPDYKELVRKNQKAKTFSSSFGAIIGRGGISPIVLVGKLMQLKQLDPDYVCPRCQGMHAETIMITFCPSCHDRHDESVLRTCQKCSYDFQANLPEETLWQQIDLGAVASRPTAATGWLGGKVVDRGGWRSRLNSATATAPLPQIQAAWYPDPQDARQLRWWDGCTWTEHVHPFEQPATHQ